VVIIVDVLVVVVAANEDAAADAGVDLNFLSYMYGF